MSLFVLVGDGCWSISSILEWSALLASTEEEVELESSFGDGLVDMLEVCLVLSVPCSPGRRSS